MPITAKTPEPEDEPEEVKFDSGFSDYLREIENLRKAKTALRALRLYKDYNAVVHDATIGKDGFRTPFLMVIGPQGVGKSANFRNLPNCKYIDNAASAVGLYRSMYLNRNKDAIILDDVDGLLQDDPSICLLKNAGDTYDQRLICWNKQNRSLLKEGIPLRFKTKMRIVVIANECPKASSTKRGANIKALLGRVSDFCFFLPIAEEVHDYVKTWFPREHMDIHQEMEKYLDKLGCPSCRWYMQALTQKRLGRDWKGWLKNQIEAIDPVLWSFVELEKNGALTVEERIEKFKAITGLTSRQTYFTYKKIYQKLRGLGEL